MHSRKMLLLQLDKSRIHCHDLFPVMHSIQRDSSYSDFYWQAGYGAFSVSQSAVATVKRYIADQETHHSKQTFQSEFRKLLNRHEIDFDERYVWD